MLKAKFVCGLIFCLIVVPAINGSAQDRDSTIETIEKSWKNRLSDAGPVELLFETTIKDRVTAAMLNADATPETRSDFPGVRILNYTITTRIVTDGEKILLELKGDRHLEGLTISSCDFISVNDGKHNKSCFEPTLYSKHRSGFISGPDETSNYNCYDNLPVNWSFLPFHKRISRVDLMSMQVKEELLNGKKILKLKQRLGDHAEDTFYVDPENNNIIRSETWINGELKVRYDCEYAIRNGIDIPVKWNIVRYSGGTIMCERESIIKKFAPHSPVNDKTFTLKFPVGTVVSDGTRAEAKASRTGTYDYIVIEGDKERPILWSERSVSYEDLLKTAPGEAVK